MTEERRFLSVMIGGKSDEEIVEFVETLGGAEPVLELVFALMPQELDPAKARDCVLGWEISQGDQTFTYRTEIKNGTLTAERRAPDDANAVIVASMPEFLRIIIEEVEAPKEYVLGKLKVRGDLVLAYSLPAMFPFKEKGAPAPMAG
jgi:alkyl sulfatase BDS1-like metallo-beta-lactamase superfamily hydrolase